MARSAPFRARGEISAGRRQRSRRLGDNLLSLTLSARSRLGPHEMLAPLGAGGMGEVYRARDPRLEPDVAIEILRSRLGLAVTEKIVLPFHVFFTWRPAA